MNVAEGTRTSPEVQPPIRNNYVQRKGGSYIIQRIKYLIAFQTFLGINRLYLIGCQSCFYRFCYTYNILLALSSIGVIIVVQLYSASQFLYRNAVVIEYLLLAVSAMFLQRKQLNSFFSKLQTLDESLNICDDVKLTSPIRFYFFGICVTLLYSFYEHTLYIGYGVYKYTYSVIYAASLGLVVHDIEMIFFCILIGMVLRRLRVIKAHVSKVFSISIDTEDSEDINKLEALSKKATLDISSMHKAYDLLYKCSQQLNSIMTLPITVMLVAAGLSTILTLKNLIYIIQTKQHPNSDDEKAITVLIVIGVGRSCKYILLMMFPCYYANVTRTQVDIIRTMLHDVLNNKNQLDKIERRKLKAFSQLCQDNGFLYEMWGVVRLDMTLPLSYTSLCTTYLIIFIQFSKFID